MPIVEVLSNALAILTHAGYKKKKSCSLIADRTASRVHHKDPRNVPSLSPTDDPARVNLPKLWPGDPIPPVVPYKRELTSFDLLRGINLNAHIEGI